MEGASGPIGGLHHLHLARETSRLSWALKIYSTSPSIRGDAYWARPQCWRWLEACHKTANRLATPDRTNKRTGHIVDALFPADILASTEKIKNKARRKNDNTINLG